MTPGDLAWAAFAAVLAAATWTDLRRRRIPNYLTLPALFVALTIALSQGRFMAAGAGAIVGAAFFVLPMFIYGLGAAGGGDVKLAAFMGAALGTYGLLIALMVAGVAASVTVLAGMAAGRLERRSKVPFGPFLALGGVAAVALGYVP